MKKETKQFLILSFKTHWILYSFCYLIYTYVVWDLRNPFQWVLNMSKYDSSDRIDLLFAIFGYIVLVGFLALNVKLFKDEK